MEFFTSPEDLEGWIKIQDDSDTAASKIMDIIGREEEQDVVETCKTIFESDDKSNAENASKILFGVLANHDITQIKQSSNKKLRKEAQMMRQDAVYGNMPMRICPKLPFSVGKRLISTYNCRHYCLDSIVFDDDPLRVYCAEALWRKHVMDKFSQAWRDEEGKLVGGYINERFQVYHDLGGNQLSLAKHERTRKPRPHQYSIERRLSEGRGEDTYDITASGNKSIMKNSKSNSIVKLASGDNSINKNDKVYKAFSQIIDLKSTGMGDEEILDKVSQSKNMSIFDVAKLVRVASNKIKSRNGLLYSCDNNSINKQAISNTIPENVTMVTKKDVQVINSKNGQLTKLKMETPVVKVSNDLFEIVDGPDAGLRFTLSDNFNVESDFGILDDVDGSIQEDADEVGLNSDMSDIHDDFPIVEK